LVKPRHAVQSVRNAVGTIKDVVAFFNASAKRNFIMKRIAFRQLQSLCETRWIERHDAVLHFCSELSTIVRALRSISRWDDTQTSSKASSFAHALCSCEFIVSIFALCDVLSVTLPISKQLQSVQIDFQEAKTTIQDALSVLRKRRVDFEHFEGVFAEANATMKSLDVSVIMPRVSERQVNRANPPAIVSPS
jgi:hypothetical protein